MCEEAGLTLNQVCKQWLVIFCAALVAAGCQRTGGSSDASVTAASSTTPGQTVTSNLLVAGDSLRFIEHSENLPVGFPSQTKALLVTNPYEGDKRAIGVGGQLFIGYNCLDCHGAEGSGAMGPSFQDGRWHFGGSPGEVFESIYQGRPDGMPAWGGRISNDQIWMLTAYVRSLSSKDLSTENFTGKTVERTGH
jgi:cytochrome c oxidase cbb3-type subunit III